MKETELLANKLKVITKRERSIYALMQNEKKTSDVNEPSKQKIMD